MLDEQDLSNETEGELESFIQDASNLVGDLEYSSPSFFEVSNNPPFPSSGENTTESDQDINPTDPFTITVNGSTDSVGVQTSPITIDCVGGSALYPARGTGTSPQTVTYSSPSAVSFSPGTGTTMFVVYAKVSATMTATAGIEVSTTGNIIISETSSAADRVGSNTRYVNNGSNSYTFFFLIGNVAVSRRSDGRYKVFISQIQDGNYTYGNVVSTTATASSSTVSTKDGLRKFTICINREPFTADIDVSNIVKVT